jgi:hypothetical protein
LWIVVCPFVLFTTKNTGKYDSIGDKKGKKTYMELYVDTPPSLPQKKIPINSFVL